MIFIHYNIKIEKKALIMKLKLEERQKKYL